MKLLVSALLLASSVAFAQPPAKKAAPAAKPAAAPAPVTAGFVGNKDSKIFHKAECKMAAKLKAEHKATFATKAEAEKAGYKPCKVCKP